LHSLRHILSAFLSCAAEVRCASGRAGPWPQGILIVGHEGRLSDLLTDLTGQRSLPFSHGEVVCVAGTCLTDLVAGRGEIRFRYPTYDHQEEPLRSKVQSKMTISTFLAGFVFTAPSALLLLTPDRWAVEQVVAVVSLTMSLALFVACVYIYDQLGMPSGFWTDADPPRLWKRWYQRLERRREDQWHAVAEIHGAEEADDRIRPQLQDGAQASRDDQHVASVVHTGHVALAHRLPCTPGGHRRCTDDHRGYHWAPPRQCAGPVPTS
jgi:hypothetical protein